MSKAPYRARAVLSIILMLTVAPVVAIVTLTCLHPSQWTGDSNPIAMLGFVVFALPFAFLTTPLWPTYFPAIILTPIVMKWISRRPSFSAAPLLPFLLCAFLAGAVAGVGVMAGLIFMALRETPGEAMPWVWMGIVSGGITFTLIALIYRQPKTLV